MNYRHIFHAGNFADAFKHIILIALTKSFLRKDTAFCYLDTHAGIGSYNLHSDSAQKSKEYQNGVEKILQANNRPSAINDYIACVEKTIGQHIYPGSPDIVKHFLRPQDRMLLCELHPDDFQTLKKYYARNKQIAVHHQDAYQSLKAYLPPKEKRGLILIDPPYENTNEFSHIINTLPLALKRFENGVYAIWYPIKNYKTIELFHKNLKETISRPILTCDLTIYPDDIANQLNGCGMAIINPPYQLDEQLNEIMPWLWQTLSVNQQGRVNLKNL